MTTSLNGDAGRAALTWMLGETVTTATCGRGVFFGSRAAPALAVRNATATTAGSESREDNERITRTLPYFATFTNASSSIFTSVSRSYENCCP